MLLVQELMSQPAVACHPEDSLDAAVELMVHRDCGALPIIDSEGAVIGMITDRDISVAAHLRGLPLREIAVAEVARGTRVHCVAPNDTICHAENVMRENRVRRVPVVSQSDGLVGILSLSDLVRMAEYATSRHRHHNHITTETVLHTLEVISQPNCWHKIQP
jgi:CBS domain-containing protein